MRVKRAFYQDIQHRTQIRTSICERFSSGQLEDVVGAWNCSCQSSHMHVRRTRNVSVGSASGVRSSAEGRIQDLVGEGLDPAWKLNPV